MKTVGTSSKIDEDETLALEIVRCSRQDIKVGNQALIGL